MVTSKLLIFKKIVNPKPQIIPNYHEQLFNRFLFPPAGLSRLRASGQVNLCPWPRPGWERVGLYP